MRNPVIPGLVIAWLLFSSSADAKPSAPITDVLLYPGGATIVRTVQVRPGMKQAVITGLPSSFDMQTLHAEAGEGVRIGEIESSETSATHAVNPAEAGLEAKITALRDRQAELDAEAKSAQMVLDYLTHQATADGSADDAHYRSAPVDAKTLTSMANAMRSESGKALARMQALAVQKREIGKNIDALERDLARLRSGETDTRTLTVALAATRAGTLSISYQVANAGWKPAYRASLNSETSVVELERQAIISQKTGEDWDNVRLTLSTSQPRQAASGAEPRPWLLSYVEEVAREALMESAPMAAAAPALRMRAPVAANVSKAEAEDSYEPPTFETQGMFANEFQVPARASLPADGREVSVVLTRQDVAVKQYFQANPRQEPAVYVTAEADMPPGDWPRGNMQLFRNGSYVGSSAWNPQARDKLVLGFGRDEQIRVAIAPVRTDSGSSGIISKRRQKKIATLYSFVNRHSRPVELKVLEASPVSTSDEVRVRSEFAPKPTQETWEGKRGVVAWDVKLAPRETAKIKTDYEIDYPAEGELVGFR